MPLRLATYNVEWFDALFDDAGQPRRDGGWSRRHDVTRAQQLDALSLVFQTLDADLVLVVEAPDSHSRRDGVAALERFARQAGLRARAGLIGFANQTQQELILLYDPDRVSVAHDPGDGPGAPRFDQSLAIDLDTDAAPEEVRFSKPPLEVVVTPVGGTPLRLIGAHLKSKAPHGARGKAAVMAQSIANRRKQLAQAIWLRRRVDAHLTAGQPLILMGDLNDGPGLDAYESLFGRSSVEILLGQEAPLFDPHAEQALSRRLGPTPTTARFYLSDQRRYMQALLDYIMVSSDLRARGPKWRIWHPFDDPECWQSPALREALLTASDHFPVSVDLPEVQDLGRSS